jgi:hypothetical protein
MIGLQLDMETANNITRLTLTDYRDYLKSENEQWEANPKDEDNPDGYWLHPEDYARNFKTVKRIDKILNDFGGELYGERQAREFSSSPSMVEASKGLEAYFLEIRKSAAKASD